MSEVCTPILVVGPAYESYSQCTLPGIRVVVIGWIQFVVGISMLIVYGNVILTTALSMMDALTLSKTPTMLAKCSW